ncbi:peptide chain release factor 1 [bacterium]|nr:peptide chain release factor 1 [bacterium]
MLEKLQEIKNQYTELEKKLVDPEVLSDHNTYREYAKTYSDLSPIVSAFEKYKKTLKEIEETEALIELEDDDEFVEMAKNELESLYERRDVLENQLKILIIPRDPNDEKNIIMEIRKAAGGEEAGLFAGDLFRLYGRYAENHGWKVDIYDSHPSNLGGFDKIVFSIEGKGVYSRLKYEGGVHRVQRVPVTESSGRKHTSTVTVVVLPEAEEIEVEIDPEDLRIDCYRSSGPGGQSVNTTDSAVRITHIPTGLVVACQDEKSQHKNKAKAMKVLRSRLLEQMTAEQDAERASARKLMVKSGERSEKIRTYNFYEKRVSEHRIHLTLHQLDAIMNGDLDPIIDELIIADQAEQLEEL